MDWLTPAIIANLATVVAITAATFFLYHQERQRCLKLWAWAFGFHALRSALDLVVAQGLAMVWAAPVLMLLTLAHGLFTLAGTFAFLGRPLPRWLYWAGGAGAAWVALAAGLGLSLAWAGTPLFVAVGLANLANGWIILRAPILGGLSRPFTGWCFILWGLHRANYPLLREAAWFAPWGFLLGGFLGLLTALGLLLAYFEKSKRVLTASEARYRALFDSINDAVFVVDFGDPARAGRFLEVNEVACRRLGYRRDELLTMTPMEVDAPESAARVPEVVKALMAQGHLLFEAVHLTKQGRRIPVEVSIHLFELEGRPAGLALARDISERKAATERIRQLADIVASAGEAIIGLDAQGRITSWNRGA